jgi:hypothetical protein
MVVVDFLQRPRRPQRNPCPLTAIVYALGVYVEATAAKKALHHHRGDSVEELEANERLYDGRHS